MAGLIVILLYGFKLAFLASLVCVRTKEFSLKSEVKKAYLHAHKRILIMHAIMKEVYSGVLAVSERHAGYSATLVINHNVVFNN